MLREIAMRMYILMFAVTIIALARSESQYERPEPGDLALVLNEEEFEDYLDSWLEIEEQKWVRKGGRALETNAEPRSGCNIQVNGDFGQPQPVFIRKNTNAYLSADGNTGTINLSTGEEVIVSCPGTRRQLVHPLASTNLHTGEVKCVNEVQISGPGWLDGVGMISHLTCSNNAIYDAIDTGDTCFNNGTLASGGFTVNEVFHPLYWSCIDINNLDVTYVRHTLNAENAVHQTNVSRPSWKSAGFFPPSIINMAYRKSSQKRAIAALVGKELAEIYINNTHYLARGHLAAKTDYVFATAQRATFFYMNAVPQWQPFNAGNWNWLEQNLRKRIGEAGYNTVIYSGTFGVAQLRNGDGEFVDIYLYNGDRVPVPLYMYKVVYDESKRIGTAFIAINNPYYTIEEARNLQFCTDHCRNNPAFDWLRWQPDRIDIGYSFCCTVDDFRRQVPHLPEFVVNGLLS